MGVPIMGTSIPAEYIRFLISQPGCSLWLDPDAGGDGAVARYARPLRAAGVPARVIRSVKDPKAHTIEEIKEYVWNSTAQGPAL
jgi:DNA primase